MKSDELLDATTDILRKDNLEEMATIGEYIDNVLKKIYKFAKFFHNFEKTLIYYFAL